MYIKTRSALISCPFSLLRQGYETMTRIIHCYQILMEGRFGCISKASLNASLASLQTPYTWICWRCNKCSIPTGTVPLQSMQSIRKLGIVPASKPRYAVVSFLDQIFRDSKTGNSPMPNISLSSGISPASNSRWTREGSSPSR